MTCRDNFPQDELNCPIKFDADLVDWLNAMHKSELEYHTPQSGGGILVSGFTPLITGAQLSALPVGVDTEVYRQPLPALTNPSDCRDLMFTLFYRSGTARMQLGPGNWYTASWDGAGNGAASIEFSTIGQTSPQGEFIGGLPVTQFGTGVLTPNQSFALPDIVMRMRPNVQNPSGFDIFPGGGLVQALWHWTLI